MPIVSSEGWAADLERALPSGLVQQSRIASDPPPEMASAALRLWSLFVPVPRRVEATNRRRDWRHVLFRAFSSRSLNRMRDL